MLFCPRKYSIVAFFAGNVNITAPGTRNISCYEDGLQRAVQPYNSYCVIYEGRNVTNGTITHQYFIGNERFPLNIATVSSRATVYPKD